MTGHQQLGMQQQQLCTTDGRPSLEESPLHQRADPFQSGRGPSDIYEEVSNILTEEEFKEIYDKSTEERYGSLIIDCSGKQKRFLKGLDFELILTKKTPQNNNIDK
jgi:hypothetical protein